MRGTLSICCSFLLLAGCNRDAQTVERDLKSAQSLTLIYPLISPSQGVVEKSVVITDTTEVRDILATIAVKKTEKGTQASRYGSMVEFKLKDGTKALVTFLDRTRLDRREWGFLELRDSRFFERMSQLAAKAEGKPVDLLKLQ